MGPFLSLSAVLSFMLHFVVTLQNIHKPLILHAFQLDKWGVRELECLQSPGHKGSRDAYMENRPGRYRPENQHPNPTEQPGQPVNPQPQQGRAAGRESLQGPTTVDRSKQLQPQPESTLSRTVEWIRDLYERNGWVFLPLGEADSIERGKVDLHPGSILSPLEKILLATGPEAEDIQALSRDDVVRELREQGVNIDNIDTLVKLIEQKLYPNIK